jgi:hypothetical protein
VRLPPESATFAFHIGESRNAFYTAGKWLRQIPARRNNRELVQGPKSDF